MYFGGNYSNAALNSNLHVYYDSVVSINMVITGQIQEDYIGVMDVFFYMWTIYLQFVLFVQLFQFARSIWGCCVALI
jgi:hypothetical protein